MTDDIKAPEVPDTNGVNLKFNAAVHSFCERILREVRIVNDHIEEAKSDIEKIEERERERLGERKIMVSAGQLAGVVVALITIWLVLFGFIWTDNKDLNKKMFEAEKYHALQEPQDKKIEALENRLLELERQSHLPEE